MQEKCDVLEDRCRQLQDSNDNSWEEKVAAEKHAEDLSARSALLEQRVSELETKLESTSEELCFTKNQLSYTLDDKRALAEKVLLLETSIANIQVPTSTDENLKDVLAEKEAELPEMKQVLTQDEAVVKQWEDRVNDLESELRHLQEQLVEQETEANSAIEQWQTTYADLEMKCSELEVKLANAEGEIGQNATKLADRD
jgi:chromosome segregation ATPase